MLLAANIYLHCSSEVLTFTLQKVILGVLLAGSCSHRDHWAVFLLYGSGFRPKFCVRLLLAPSLFLISSLMSRVEQRVKSCKCDWDGRLACPKRKDSRCF